MRSTFLLFIMSLIIISCTPPPVADTIYINGNIYTMDEENEQVEAVAVAKDKIVFVGTKEEAMKWRSDHTAIIDLEGKTMTPGLIESHGHLMGLGYNELNLDLMDVRSYEEMVERVKDAVEKASPGEWILGRGWHQSKWDSLPKNIVGGFQTHVLLSAVSPENPVYLSHASGHAAMANAKAMEIAGVNQLSVENFNEIEVQGGEVFRDEFGNPTGVFNETAQRLISKHIPENTPERDRMALELAIKACHRNGITSFHDAGVGRDVIELYQKFLKEGKLDIRNYVMVTGRDQVLVNEWLEKGIYVDSSHWLTIRSIKLNCDGALGSRGAWLLEEYTDMPGHMGHETLPMEVVSEVSEKALKSGFQVCSHAIGDRANQEILDRYEKAFNADTDASENHRFRIEHAQHLHPDDIPRFGQLGVIAAMQAIHMSSDRPWAIDRLGEKRIVEGAYMWQELLKTGAKVINGTDVPVEPIDPIASFYASVTRKTLKGEPEGGYEPIQKMTREQALKSYTLDAAYGEFGETIKGSIEVGKLADFTVFSKDIMTVDEKSILKTVIEMTIIGGKTVYIR
ncbi:MAG: amidohydrolase [Cyclobacteriaceae bacterium]|nr:amidohydrolase [Cyclobacteriaceae bacterium]